MQIDILETIATYIGISAQFRPSNDEVATLGEDVSVAPFFIKLSP